MGLEQLKKLDKICSIRHKNFIYYKKKLSNFGHQKSSLDLISSFGYVTFVKNRMQVYKHLKKNKIESRPVICGNMGQQPFLKKFVIIKKDLINAKFVDKYGIYLPNHANLSFTKILIILSKFLSQFQFQLSSKV